MLKIIDKYLGKNLFHLFLLVASFSGISIQSASGVPLSQQISDLHGSSFLRQSSSYNNVSDDMSHWHNKIDETIRRYDLNNMKDPSLSIKAEQFNDIFSDPNLKLIYKGKHTSLIIIDRLYDTHCWFNASMRYRKAKKILQACATVCKEELKEKSKPFEDPINTRFRIVEQNIARVDTIFKAIDRLTGKYFHEYLMGSKDKNS